MPSWPWPVCGFSETGPLNGKHDLPCPAKASADTNMVSPVTLPVPPETTTPSHKELSQFASPFLNPVAHLSTLPHHQLQVELGASVAGRSQGLTGSHSHSPVCLSFTLSHPMCNQALLSDSRHSPNPLLLGYSGANRQKGLQRGQDIYACLWLLVSTHQPPTLSLPMRFLLPTPSLKPDAAILTCV